MSALGKVLVVDDEPRNVRLLQGFLLAADYDVVTAANGEEALAAVAAEAPDLVLLDIMMPVMDGYETCRRIKEDKRTFFLPVVMVTALNERRDRVLALESGADDFLPKPVEETELLARVKSIIRVKQLHDSLQRSYDDLRASEELRDNLTHMIVHDMRTLLMSLVGGLELIRVTGETVSPQDGCDYLEVAWSSAHLLRNMTTDLLDLNRMEAGKLEIARQPVDFGKVTLAAEKQMTGLAASEGRTLEFDVAADLPPLTGDRELLARVLVNLVSNALKFTSAGDCVKVTARTCPSTADLAGTWVEWQVTDNGPGIPAEYQERIFDKFEQVQTRAAGKKYSTGLGLTFCKMAVEAHGGKIWVESQPGQGCTFFVRLPVTAA